MHVAWPAVALLHIPRPAFVFHSADNLSGVAGRKKGEAAAGAQGEGCSTDRDAAERLARDLRSSLTRGLSSDADELARRAQALGSNSLPERDQVLFLRTLFLCNPPAEPNI